MPASGRNDGRERVRSHPHPGWWSEVGRVVGSGPPVSAMWDQRQKLGTFPGRSAGKRP